MLVLPSCLAALVAGVSSLPRRRDMSESLHASSSSESTANGGERDLAFLHVPYNFGHTVEKVSAFGNGLEATLKFSSYDTLVSSGHKTIAGDVDANDIQDNGVLWGALYPGLSSMSSVGCPMYMTPPQHWPQDLAQLYFGNRKVFGVLRDPYERLVAYFRGSNSRPSSYGGDFSQWFDDCDLDAAIRSMLEEYKNASDPFVHQCTYLPQVNYFGGKFGNASKFGITEAVDNRRFPMSANDMFSKHGYDFQIEIADSMHVSGCNEVWSAAFTPYTRNLIRQVYADDFKLICDRFGYCDEDEDTCIACVPEMCPSNMTKVGTRACLDAAAAADM